MTMDKVRSLHLEDSESDAELVHSELKRFGFLIEWRREVTREGFLAGLRDFMPDVVLADYSLPSYDGLAALMDVRKTHPEIPFIFVTGTRGEDLAVESLRGGATDFVVKSSLGRLGPVVKRALREMAAATEQARLHALVAESEQKYRALFEHNSDGVLIADVQSRRFRLANSKTCDMFGYSEEELRALGVGDIHPKDELPRVLEVFEKQSKGETIVAENIPCLRKDKTVFYADISTGRAMISGRLCLLGMFRDITERKRAEEEREKLRAQLEQAQKMESVGRLAGGVAHDFNNILTAINGYTGFALAGMAEGDSRRADLEEVLAAGQRATRLTRQLLAFSRKQILKPEVLDINGAVGGIVNMLKRLIGEDIKLVTHLVAQPCLAKVDAGQIEQVFLNLAVNARDAMPRGGTLTFETGILTPTEDFSLRHPDMPRGSLVCLSVRDTGCGMTDEVKARLFEPFFTTKEKGKGTGLGLATVYGIIKQSGGEIEIETAPGRGTTFRIYLREIDAQALDKDKDKDKDKDMDSMPQGNETVLLVEDEESIRRLGARALRVNGYFVLTAADGQETLKVLERHGKPVDLLITDVVMPGMSGRELAQTIAKKNLARRTLFVSGYTDDAIVQHGVLEPGLAFLNKPFTPNDLLLKIRLVLDGPADKAKA